MILTFSILEVYGTIIQLFPLSLSLQHRACNTATAQITESAATSWGQFRGSLPGHDWGSGVRQIFTATAGYGALPKSYNPPRLAANAWALPDTASSTGTAFRPDPTPSKSAPVIWSESDVDIVESLLFNEESWVSYRAPISPQTTWLLQHQPIWGPSGILTTWTG